MTKLKSFINKVVKMQQFTKRRFINKVVKMQRFTKHRFKKTKL